ncbi:hypothetical protein MACJ_000128 [Theileria orientalis]|uniref:Uncharacterized protein n=1 Tax=Theileria orientalis TaxID=68886 RepID=A0A976M3J6_THEOR|nr:hypothetical protein MACJ_000128 [Theileria orientalis]
MKFALESSSPILRFNAYNILGSTNHFNLKTLLNNFLTAKSDFSTIPEGQKSTLNTIKIPHWIDGDVPSVKTDEIVGTNVDNQLKVLKRIRPFRLNQLSVFNPNPYSLSKPIKKNPVLKHLWKLRVNTVYRRDSSKRIVVNASIVKHILTHTDTIFDVILTTRKDLIDFVFSNRDYSSRFSRIQLVDKYTLQYCLRGTTQSYNLVDTVAEAFVPPENKEISPRWVISLYMVPRFVLAFDNIKYTQNLGSLIRTSIALGVDLLYYIKGTTDPFNWKVSSITGGVQYSIPHRFGTLIK